MRLMDERQRLLRIVNPIDLVVMLVLVVGAVVAVRLVFQPGGEPDPTTPVEFDILAVRLHEFDSDSIDVGDKVFERTLGPLGEVTGVSVEPAGVDLLVDNKLVWTESAGLKTVRIRVRAEATVTAEGYVVRGRPIRENAILSIYTEHFEAATAYVTNVEAMR